MIEFTTSWDDGAVTDIQLAELLRKYKIPAVFYIPTCCEITPDIIRDFAKTFEIGGHTKTHPMDIKKLKDNHIRHELEDNKKWLEYLTGKPVTKFCHVRGRYDDRVLKILPELGFTEARTTVIGNLAKPVDMFTKPTTVHTFNRPEYGGLDWLSYAKQKWIDAMEMEDACYHLWGHSKELHVNDDWDKLEELFKFINADLYP